MSLEGSIRLRVRKEVVLTVTTAGTPVKIADYLYGEAVRIINNNAAATVAIGMAATVDANSTPEIGTVIYQNESHIEYGKESDQVSLFDEIYVDATVNGTKVTVQYMGK